MIIDVRQENPSENFQFQYAEGRFITVPVGEDGLFFETAGQLTMLAYSPDEMRALGRALSRAMATIRDRAADARTGLSEGAGQTTP